MIVKRMRSEKNFYRVIRFRQYPADLFPLLHEFHDMKIIATLHALLHERASSGRVRCRHVRFACESACSHEGTCIVITQLNSGQKTGTLGTRPTGCIKEWAGEWTVEIGSGGLYGDE